MIHIRFIAADLTARDIACAPGQSLMKAAIDAQVPGIDADCGGTLTCATCHVMIDAPWSALLPPPVPDETDMLDFAASAVQPGSRLSCQVMLTPGLDGLVVHLPPTQY